MGKGSIVVIVVHDGIERRRPHGIEGEVDHSRLRLRWNELGFSRAETHLAALDELPGEIWSVR
jgi:hypothetical protein